MNIRPISQKKKLLIKHNNKNYEEKKFSEETERDENKIKNKKQKKNRANIKIKQ